MGPNKKVWMGAYVLDLVSSAHPPESDDVKVLIAVAKELSDVGYFNEWSPHDAAYSYHGPF